MQALDAASASSSPKTWQVRRATSVMVGALLVLVLASAFVAWRRMTPAADATIRTVAVLPFVNTGGNPADDYFSDGMTDELAHGLARLPGLRVAGRTSTYSFKGRSVPAQEIGRALAVSALVEGTVRRAGDRLRVTTQLVSASDGTVLWEDKYESQSNDVFAVQDQFTRAVVEALAPTLAHQAADAPVVDVGRGTTDLEAYQLYLKGRYYWLARGGANVVRSIDYFHQAIARDPNFARAYAGLALAYNVLTVYVPDPKDSVPALLAASTKRALALDSTLADAQIAGALMHERVQLDFPAAMAHYRKAIAVEPSNSYAHHSFGFFLIALGHTDEAIRELTRASQLDPLAKSAGTALALALSFARRGSEAVVAARRVLALDPDFALGINTLGIVQIVSGQPDSGMRSMERARQLSPDMPSRLCYLIFADAAAGRWADAERIRTALHRPGGDHSGGIEVAFADLVFGNREPLVRLLATKAGQESWHRQYLFGCNPLLDPLWTDERFTDAMRKLAVTPCTLARPWSFPSRG